MSRRDLLGAAAAYLLRQHRKDAAGIGSDDDFIYRESASIRSRAAFRHPTGAGRVAETIRVMDGEARQDLNTKCWWLLVDSISLQARFPLSRCRRVSKAVRWKFQLDWILAFTPHQLAQGEGSYRSSWSDSRSFTICRDSPLLIAPEISEHRGAGQFEQKPCVMTSASCGAARKFGAGEFSASTLASVGLSSSAWKRAARLSRRLRRSGSNAYRGCLCAADPIASAKYGAPMSAMSSRLMGQVDGCDVITVEDLANEGITSRAAGDGRSSRFADCGFPVRPDLWMAPPLFGLFYEPHDKPLDRAAVNNWIAGNLCRC